GKFFRVEWVSEANQAGIGLEQLRVGKRHVLLCVWFDGEDAHLEHVLACVFEQRRVAQLADNVLVNPARFLRRHQLGLDRFAIDLHRELFDLRAFRNWKQKGAFDPLRIRIVKLLFDGRGGKLVVDADVCLVLRDFQGAELVNARGWDWPWPRPRSRSGAWRWPR